MVVPMATSITGSLVRVGGGVKWLLGTSDSSVQFQLPGRFSALRKRVALNKNAACLLIVYIDSSTRKLRLKAH